MLHVAIQNSLNDFIYPTLHVHRLERITVLLGVLLHTMVFPLYHVTGDKFQSERNAVFWDMTMPCGCCKNRRSSETSALTKTARRPYITEDSILRCNI
jgi:hypothetical protein